MNFLKRERETLAKLIPSLDETLAGIPLMTMEQRGNPAISLFKEAGGTGMLIPESYGGAGASPLQAVHAQCAVANRAPSLAIAAAMHHFSVATVIEMVRHQAGAGLEWMLLEGIARQKLYVASGFAEGRSGVGILSSSIRATRTADGIIISGSKKPCSLSASMDLLTASLLIPKEEGGEPELAVATIPSDTPGIERRPFWGSLVLAGAESDEVVLNEVFVPGGLVYYLGSPSRLDLIQARGFLWFELLITASYIGIATALVERVLASGRGGSAERILPVVELKGAMTALEGVAHSMGDEEAGQDDLLARALFVRYAAQRAIERATSQAVELLGGMAFVSSPDVAYLFAASRGLAFHPPSRLSISASLDKYLSGEHLVIE